MSGCRFIKPDLLGFCTLDLLNPIQAHPEPFRSTFFNPYISNEKDQLPLRPCTFYAGAFIRCLPGFCPDNEQDPGAVGIQSIYVNSNYTVYLKQTNKQEVKVEALADIYSLTEIKVENGVLLINVEKKT